MRKKPKGDTWDGIFADPEVGRVLHVNGLIADANKSSIKELATITSLNPSDAWNGSYFYNNQDITQFPELQYCTGLTSLTNTFYGCTSLTEVILPSSVTNLSSTFSQCTSLATAPVIPNGVTRLYDTFYECSNLTTVGDIPNSVTYMRSAFSQCTSLLEAPVIPSSVTNLEYTFLTCSSIDGIYIINAVTPPAYKKSLSNVQAIYVPDASVSRYKSASGWSGFSSKIYKMSTKP